jgi:hypothetical protein
MRTTVKANAKQGNVSKALAYRSGVFSACTDLEALVDAYGENVIIEMVGRIASDMRKHGDSIFNGEYNAMLNKMAYPELRKKNKSRGEQSELRRAIANARKAAQEAMQGQ